MSQILVYDNCQLDTWIPNIGPTINSIPADEILPILEGGTDPTSGSLILENRSSKEMGGGLISRDYALPTAFVPLYFAMNVRYWISSLDLEHINRHELDLKVTLKSGATTPIPNQINGSNQQNFSEGGMWQLDPTGNAWVDSGYSPGPPSPDIWNDMQFRWSTTGSLWSVTALCQNSGTVFTPGAQFQNVPVISTNWGAGLHPQLQTEVKGAPAILQVRYGRIQIISSDAAIRMGWF